MEFIVLHVLSVAGAIRDRDRIGARQGVHRARRGAIARSACFIPTLILGLLIPITASASPDSVRYTTPDGFRVHAHYYRPEAPTTRAVLILPDGREGKEAWTTIADSLSATGFHVLAADLRGTGESMMQRGLRRDRGSFTARERAAGAIDGQAGMRYLRNLRAGPISELVVIGSGTGAVGVLGCLADGFERVTALLVSPRAIPVAEDQADPRKIGAGRLLIVVARDDLLGIEASARLVSGAVGRECWIAGGRARGAKLLVGRMDLFRASVDWMIGKPDVVPDAR